MTVESGRILPMLRNLSIHPGIRLALALLVSVVLHLAIFHLPDYFSMAKQPPLPKPENWKFDVAIAPKGEGVSRRAQAEAIDKKPARRMVRELAKYAVADAPAPEAAAPKENAMVVAPVQQSPEVSKQVEAMAGAMANLANMQFLLGKMKAFHAVTRAQITSGINAHFAEEAMRQHVGAVCTIKLEYVLTEPVLEQIVDCGDRQELASMLASHIDWYALPPPEKYFLPYRNMHITLWFEGFRVRIGLKTDD